MDDFYTRLVSTQAVPTRLEVTSLAAASDADYWVHRAGEVVCHNQQLALSEINEIDLYFVSVSLTTEQRHELASGFVDPATHNYQWVDSVDPTTQNFVEIALRSGVTDPVGQALVAAGKTLNIPQFLARTGKRFEFTFAPTEAAEPSTRTGQSETIRQITERLLYNAVVEEVSYGVSLDPRFSVDPPVNVVETIDVRSLSASGLVALSSARSMALDPAELDAVQRFFQSIDRDPTDAEMEMIAQTWSEHCSHKTFRAHISWENGEAVTPLLKQLRQSTDQINAPWVRSAFVDNAGIVAFDDRFDLAIKVETHNHPSAIEPFGGANTGVGGVIRDVLGVAADPIAVTNILCFGPLDTHPDDLPAGVLHPQRILDGVVAGIADYGNKIGLPTVAGAVIHSKGFTANPLVFAGCIGLRPAGLGLEGAQPGHHIVAIGGATGRDGIRGATFSSATMDATTGDVAGASVQIGDPIIEKLVADALVDAREQNLFSAITDCGAGGFSSAVGEIAATLGANIQLDVAPLKYPGLAPWEVWLSEAQERMVLAVPASSLAAFRAVCLQHGVEVADLGVFRNDGQLRVRMGESLLVDLPGAFLHDGRPQRQLIASRSESPEPTETRESQAIIASATLLLHSLLAHPDVRSNEGIVRRFDHEILGATIGRPFVGAQSNGPGDGSVLSPLGSTRGIAIGIGVNCRTGQFDARAMARAAVDEAIRNAVCVGADPHQISLLDNFSWGDPRRPETLGQLVQAVNGCVSAAESFGAPFVCGKDSLNNEYFTNTGERRSIPPTLVITALGVVPEAEQVVSSDLKAEGNSLLLVGRRGAELFGEGLRGSVLDAVLGVDGPGAVACGDDDSPARYAAVHALMREKRIRTCHDVSDGGLLVALAEMCIGGGLGLSVDLTSIAVNSDPESLLSELFSEASGRLLVEVSPETAAEAIARLGAVEIGKVTAAARLVISVSGSIVVSASVAELTHSWSGHSPRFPSPGDSEQRSSLEVSPNSSVPSFSIKLTPPSVLVVRLPGTNRDHDVSFALQTAGAQSHIVTLEELCERRDLFLQHQLLVFAGGFSYADALGAGALGGLHISRKLGDEIASFANEGNPVLGICNGFQILVRAGLLPGSLTDNRGLDGRASGFTCRWVSIAPTDVASVWTDGLHEPILCPVAHGEGRYLANADVAQTHGALAYINGTNPNGSVNDIAGVTSSNGLILGLMPHPENHVLHRQHPQFTRGATTGLGLGLFANGVNHVKHS